jgi:hypothetical protein
MLRLALSSGLCVLMLTCAATADASREQLWSLYVQEHASRVCGLELSEEEEDQLDKAQDSYRLSLSLSLSEAAVLYRRARDFAISSQKLLCGGEDAQ